MATSGPGATNLITGLASSFMDSIPVVAITGQVPRPAMGYDAFQESDITGIAGPVTKHTFLVMEPDDIAQTIAEAFHIASTGRPGPGPGRHPQRRPAGEVRATSRPVRSTCPATSRPPSRTTAR